MVPLITFSVWTIVSPSSLSVYIFRKATTENVLRRQEIRICAVHPQIVKLPLSSTSAVLAVSQICSPAWNLKPDKNRSKKTLIFCSMNVKKRNARKARESKFFDGFNCRSLKFGRKTRRSIPRLRAPEVQNWQKVWTALIRYARFCLACCDDETLRSEDLKLCTINKNVWADTNRSTS